MLRDVWFLILAEIIYVFILAQIILYSQKFCLEKSKMFATFAPALMGEVFIQ